jgi:hypothetical protein
MAKSKRPAAFAATHSKFKLYDEVRIDIRCINGLTYQQVAIVTKCWDRQGRQWAFVKIVASFDEQDALDCPTDDGFIGCVFKGRAYDTRLKGVFDAFEAMVAADEYTMNFMLESRLVN